MDEARLLAAACLAAARERDVAISIAVVDEAGGLLHFLRMDGARSFTADVAAQKARTAASLGVSTAALESLYQDRALSSGSFVATRGGAPFMHEGTCAGAVGIAGAQPEIDALIADQGLAAMRR
jgi:glc operon protein GlcG